MSFLPKKKKGRTRSPEACMWLFYGPPGIGKSTMAATFPNTCFISTTRGLGWIDAAVSEITCWDDFIETCAEIEEGDHKYQCFVVDLLADLYEFCLEWVMENELDGSHPSDFEWGKGWGAVGKEFRRVMSKLMNLKTPNGDGYGLIFIAHDNVKEVKTKIVKTDKVMPKLTKATFNWFYGLLDFVVYMKMEVIKEQGEKPREERFALFRPSIEHEAKSWCQDMPDFVNFENENLYELLSVYLGNLSKPTSKKKARKTKRKK